MLIWFNRRRHMALFCLLVVAVHAATSVRAGAKIGADRLLRVLRKIRFLAATVPEQRRIFIDKSIHQSKKKWATLHEAAHNVLPWQRAFYSYVDTAESLCISCGRERGFWTPVENE